MAYLGSWKIDDALTFPVNTHDASSGAATDADAVPAYRVYEDETATAILTGNMAKLDDTNTTGFYTEQITLSAANGFEKGKCYTIYISAAVDSVTGTKSHTFQIEAEVDSNTNSGSVAVASIANGAVTANAIAADAFTAAKFASDVGTEIGSAVWASTTRVLTAGTNIVLAKGTGITGFNDLSQANVRTAVGLASANLDTQLGAIGSNVDAVKANTDNLPTDPADQSLVIAATDAITTAIGNLNDVSAADILGATVTEGFSTAGSDPTLAQILHEIRQGTLEFSISGTTLTVKKQDGLTVAMTFTLDDDANPTSRTRAT